VLEKYSATGTEPARQAASAIFGLANSLKAQEGRLKGLQDPGPMAAKQKEEDAFKAKVIARADWKAAYGNAWDEIAATQKQAATRVKERLFRTLDSQLGSLAQTIVEYVAEIRKPDAGRLPGFHDAGLASLKFRMFSPAPVYAAMEIARLTGALQEAQAELGPNDPFVKAALDGKSPAAAAAALVNGSKLADPAVRRSLVDGGQAAVDASHDSMIALARRLDPIRRDLDKWYEDRVQSVDQRAGEQLGRARFAVYGKTAYPDATFTLRLSYGKVAGYPMNGTKAPSKTTFYGLYDRAAGFNYEGPFYLPSRYLENRDKLNLSTPLDFVSTNDIIGGNSGSPVVDARGEIVGLIFDGNIESLPGDFYYDGEVNRAVAVHTAGMTEALKKLYNAPALVKELMGD